MDFTREPVIQTVITPREGYRLVVRSSKTAGLEEHFVDAVEVVCFGTATFFRCVERPKPFIVPVSDYEVLEVREPRMVLKTPTISSQKSPEKAPRAEKQRAAQKEAAVPREAPREAPKEEEEASKERQPTETRTERRRERRRGFRRRRGGREEMPAEGEAPAELTQESLIEVESFAGEDGAIPSTAPMLSAILPPPTTLIRDDLPRLRGAYKDAFYDIENEEFPEESFGFSERDVKMSEDDASEDEGNESGGDAEVSQSEPFRDEGIFSEDAQNAKKYDE